MVLPVEIQHSGTEWSKTLGPPLVVRYHVRKVPCTLVNFMLDTKKTAQLHYPSPLSFHNTFYISLLPHTDRPPQTTSIMNQFAQAGGQSNQRWPPFRNRHALAKSPVAILAAKASWVAEEMSRKMRRLHLCGSDCVDDVITTTHVTMAIGQHITAQPPRHNRHVRLHATTWDDLLPREKLDEEGGVQHLNIRLLAVVASSPSAVVEVPPRATNRLLPDDGEDPSSKEEEEEHIAILPSPPRITRMAFCFDHNDGGRERVTTAVAIDKVARRLDPYDEDNNVFDIEDGGTSSSLEYTSSLECTSSLEYSDDDGDDDDDDYIGFQHWC